MKLSIVIPMYNVEKYIGKCIESCLEQDVDNNSYEILCVNDGSPDESAELARGFARQHTNIRVIDRPNGGLSAARNTGIDHAQGEYLFFVDSDDWIKENCLGAIIKQLNEEQPDVLAICAANMYGDDAQRRFTYQGLNPTSGPEALKHVACACAPFMIVRKNHLNENGIRFWEGIYHEDSEYMPRMLYAAKKVSYTDEVIYYVYQNPNSITRTINFKKVVDVLTIVSPHLYEFCNNNIDVAYKYLFYDKICSGVNTVLSRNTPLSASDKMKADELFYANKYLIKAFKGSSYLRFRVEGIILGLFPKHLVEVYNFMNIKRFIRC